MHDEITKQNWTKELKKRVNAIANKLIVPDRNLPELIAIINLAQQDIIDSMPDCSDCQDGMHGEPNYEHNEGYD
jgi:hypothetical protein